MPHEAPIPPEVARALLDESGDPCLVFDRQLGEVVWSNAAWRRLAGSTELCPSEPVATDMAHQVASLLARESSPTGCAAVRYPVATGTSVSAEVVAYPFAADGRGLVAAILVTPSPRWSSAAANGTCDPLTGLATRAVFEQRLEQLVGFSGGNARFAVLFLDLDGFKQVNDRWGHIAGDQVLTTIAHRLAGAVRGGDLMARYGGDEFVALVEGIDGPEELHAVVRRIRQAVEQPIEVEGAEIVISVSIGSVLAGQPPRSPAELIAEADERMYADKAAGEGPAAPQQAGD